MSITISNWKDIHDAPTNRSPAKMAYSFSKAQRFNKSIENKFQLSLSRSQIFYNLNNNQKRATSFGYGYKYDFTKE